MNLYLKDIVGIRCDRGHDKLIQNMAKSLQSLVFLQRMSIRLDWSDGSMALNNLFDSFRQVTVDGLRSLFEVISQMSLLEGVNLEFDE